MLAREARDALLAEVRTTPKPGLVDLEHRGAHADLCIDRMTASAYALEPAFASIAECARDALPTIALREELGEAGRRAETAMMRATGGSNAHRGAIWALGLLVAARASLGAQASAGAIARRAGALARLPDRFAARGSTHGAVVQRRFGAGGALGEARQNFPHVTAIAFPLVRGGAAHADILLALLAAVDDTCLLHRGGGDALAVARVGAARALAAGGTATTVGMRLVRRLDAALVARNASPGGCADLLAAGMLLARIST